MESKLDMLPTDVIRKALREIDQHRKRFSLHLGFLTQRQFSYKEIATEFFQNWFERQKGLLQEEWLLENYPDNFVEYCWVYTHAIALKFKEVGVTEISLEDAFLLDENELERWERFFGSDKLTSLMVLVCPWEVKDGYTLSLHDKEVINYFAGLTQYDLKKYLDLPFIRGNEGVEQLSEILDREVLAGYSNQLKHLVADIQTRDISKEDYFRLIYLSRTKDDFIHIAANAITVLNYAYVSFSGMDLSYIKIPNADLSGAILSHTNLSWSLLEGVNISKTFLEYTNLQNSNMKNIDFQLLPGFVLPGFVKDLKFSPNGELLIAGTEMGGTNGLLMAWDTRTHKLKYIAINKADSVKNLAFSPASDLIASSGHGVVISIWDAYTGECLKKWSVSERHLYITGLAFNENSTMLIVSNGSEEVQTQIWKLKDKDAFLYGNFPEQTQISAISYSFDGKYFAAAGKHKIIYLRETLKNTLKKLDGHLGEIICLAFSPVNYVLVSGSKNNEIILWDVLKETVLDRLTCSSSPDKIVFHPNGNHIAIGYSDSCVNIYGLNDKSHFIFENATQMIKAIAFNSNGEYLAIGAYQKIHFWKLNIPKIIKKLNKKNEALILKKFLFQKWENIGNRAFKIHLPAHNKYRDGEKYNDIHVLLEGIDAILRKIEKNYNISNDICYIGFHPNNQYLAFANNNHDDIYILDITTRSVTLILKTRAEELVFSEDGNWLASINHSWNLQLIELWKINFIGSKIGVSNQKLISHRHIITSIAFSQDGIWLSSSSNDGTIHLWNLEEQKILIIKCTERHITKIAFNEMNQLIVISTMGEYQIWEHLQTGINKQWCLVWRNKDIFFCKNVSARGVDGILEIEKEMLKSGGLIHYIAESEEREQPLENISIGPYEGDWPKYFLLFAAKLEPAKLVRRDVHLYAIPGEPKKIELQKAPSQLLNMLLLEIIKQGEHVIKVAPVGGSSYIRIARCYFILGKMENNLTLLEKAKANFLLGYQINSTTNACVHIANFFFYLEEWSKAVFYLNEALNCYEDENYDPGQTHRILFINAEKIYLNSVISKEIDQENGTLFIDSKFITFCLLIMAYIRKDSCVSNEVLNRFKEFLEEYELSINEANILRDVINRNATNHFQRVKFMDYLALYPKKITNSLECDTDESMLEVLSKIEKNRKQNLVKFTKPTSRYLFWAGLATVTIGICAIAIAEQDMIKNWFSKTF